jgi:phosphoglycerate dehydrogenase-like enzyme
MYRILYSDYDMPTFEIEERVLGDVGVEFWLAPSEDEATLAAEAETADAIITGYARLTPRVIEAAAAGPCRAIVRNGIGFDNIDIPATIRHGIPVANVPDYCVEEVADHTLAMLLALSRRLPEVAASVRAGGWDIPRDSVPRLTGQTLGIVGCGRIGQRVAARGLAFGLHVKGYDPVHPPVVDGVEIVASFEELLRVSDHITLHLPLTPETRHLIDVSAINLMERKPTLINNARGGLVDLDAVTAALDSGKLSGVGLDVFETEPLARDHPLRSHPRAIVTPHMSYYSNDSEPEAIRRSAEEVGRALRGEPVLNPVNGIAVRGATA